MDVTYNELVPFAFKPLLDTELDAYILMSCTVSTSASLLKADLILSRTEQARFLASSFVTVVQNSENLHRT